MSELSGTRFSGPATAAVAAMYDAYPYPSPIAGDSVIDDIANCIYSLYGEQSLDGFRILDAGCGTGHRLIGVARRYPGAQFIGVDMASGALHVAEDLARKHRVKNIRLQQGDLLDLHVSGEFELVISSCVIHHLENPQRGVQNLARVLAPDGILIVWHYNSLGEHERLLARELLHLMWDRHSGLTGGVQMMRDLELQLEVQKYGSAAQKTMEASRLNVDVDAYIHPIVTAYRFDEAITLFRSCPELAWAAIHNINVAGSSSLVDLAEVAYPDTRCFCQSVESLFASSQLQQRFRQLTQIEKLRVMELRLKPTGFTAIAGRARSHMQFGRRITGNTLKL